MTKPKTDKQLRILEEAREKAKLVLEEKRKIMEREKEQEKETEQDDPTWVVTPRVFRYSKIPPEERLK